MNYTLYQMEFQNGVRFGSGNLDSMEITFHADTLFSALFQEALKFEKEKEFLSRIKEGKLLFSDAFPYMGKCFYIPKPIIHIEPKAEQEQGNSRKKKFFKNLKYIPQEYLEIFFKGNFEEEYMGNLKELGSYAMKTAVAIRGKEEPEPYRIRTFCFEKGNGLYLILAYESEEDKSLFMELLESLSYTGIGGKRSAGFGRFEPMEGKMPESLRNRLTITGKTNILLSTALPQNQELEKVLEEATYTLIRRGGFIDSQNWNGKPKRKKDVYVFAPGSCFKTIFSGQVEKEETGEAHSIFRYEKALFLGVNL